MSNSYEEIRRLMYEYAECVDLADFEGLARLFAHGQMRSSTADGGMSGEAVRDFYAATNRVHPDGTLRTRHLATNIIIDLDEAGASASARSHFLVLQATVNLPLQPIVALRASRRQLALHRAHGARRSGREHVGAPDLRHRDRARRPQRHREAAGLIRRDPRESAQLRLRGMPRASWAITLRMISLEPA
jgi:hypothetical protein